MFRFLGWRAPGVQKCLLLFGASNFSDDLPGAEWNLRNIACHSKLETGQDSGQTGKCELG